jgi:hypothetical protein
MTVHIPFGQLPGSGCHNTAQFAAAAGEHDGNQTGDGQNGDDMPAISGWKWGVKGAG